jgi:class 3 adenylate cyclase
VEPQIQYTRTSDGVSIAYYAFGSGPTLIATAAHLGMSISGDWRIEPIRRIAELTARRWIYVRYDPRGSGLSDRDATDFTVEASLRDLEAVANATAPDRFALFANGVFTAPAMVYAARHPERLSHLLMWMAFSRGVDRHAPHMEAILQLAAVDWRAATESSVRAADSWEHEELASQTAALMRESVEADTYVKFERDSEEWDVREYLPQISVPTLVMHPRNHPYFPAERARRIAAAIPGARLALVESSTVLFPDTSIAAIAGEFLGIPPQRPAPTERAAPASGTTVIVFADIVDSTALTERLGDAAFRERARALDDALRALIRAAGGAAIGGKLLGDGVLATFPAANRAIDAALRFDAAARDAGLELHVGVHAGDVIRERDNVYGGAVNVAARISALAQPGEVLVSDVVRALARTSAGVTFDDRGTHELKGVDEPQRVFAVRPA